MRVVFMGTPMFAAICLKRLVESEHKVVCVVCQPDRRGNRNKITQCETAIVANELKLPILKSEKISADADKLREFKADVIVTAAYGQMLSREILSITKYGVINVHASLLPLFRGASPIQSAIISGKKETGVTIMKTIYAMDEGDIIKSEKTAISTDITADLLSDKLAHIGADLLVGALTDMENGKAILTRQCDIRNNYGRRVYPIYCKKIKASDENIDWSLSAQKVSCKIRGLSSNPGAKTLLNGCILKIYSAINVGAASPIQRKKKVGEIVSADKNGIIVKCGRGLVRIEELQLAGGKRMSAKDFVNGKKIKVGDILESDHI